MIARPKNASSGMNTRPVDSDEENEEPVCLCPYWRYPNKLTHLAILAGVVTSTALIIAPTLLLAVFAAIDKKDYPRNELLYTFGAGVADAIFTGITFFCTTRKEPKILTYQESSALKMQI